jgi:hypothetical protein
MDLEAVIDRVGRWTCRLGSNEFADACAGYAQARLEEYLEVVNWEARREQKLYSLVTSYFWEWRALNTTTFGQR